ncbi:MAG: hypothetical protein EA370_02985 [Wenzhouxiangella sp.]|nr:MAG: hypothetical protein EA370_02985 [Wenzhouxiangella sp.]
MKQLQIVSCVVVVLTSGLFQAFAHSSEMFEWITDPVELAELGFEPDGPGVQRLVHLPDERSLEEQLADRIARLPGDIGGASVRWASVQATDFQPLSDGGTYATMGNFIYSCTQASANSFADAPIHLADSRRLAYFDVWTFDSSDTQDVNVDLNRVCQSDSAPFTPVVTLLATRSSSGSGGNQFSFVSIPGSVFTQNQSCSYWVRARFESGCDAGNNLRVQKARVIWD